MAGEVKRPSRNFCLALRCLGYSRGLSLYARGPAFPGNAGRAGTSAAVTPGFRGHPVSVVLGARTAEC